jgi:hypothetical protein
MKLRLLLPALCIVAMLSSTASAATPPASFPVDARIAVASLMSIVDGHMHALEDSLDLIAASDEARSGDWNHIKPLLVRAGKGNVDAVLAYVKSDGSYWTVQSGLQTANLADRPYFKPAMAGETLIGGMNTSRSTGRAVADVIVPVKGTNGKVTGIVLGAVYLDSLSKLVQQEMALDPNDIFFSFNSDALVGINWDQKQIFLEARKLSPDIDRAFGQMLAHDSGVESYTHRGQVRTVVYRKSSYTNWWYAFGVVH